MNTAEHAFGEMPSATLSLTNLFFCTSFGTCCLGGVDARGILAKKKLQLSQSWAFSRDLGTPGFSLAVNFNIMQVWSILGLCSLQSKDLKEVCAVCDSIVWRGWEMRYMTSKYATAFFWNNTVIVRMCDILGTGSDQFIPLNNPNYCLLTSTNCLKVFWIITRDLFSKLLKATSSRATTTHLRVIVNERTADYFWTYSINILMLVVEHII